MYDNSDLLLLKIESEEILSVVIKVSANSDQFQEKLEHINKVYNNKGIQLLSELQRNQMNKSILNKMINRINIYE